MLRPTTLTLVLPEPPSLNVMLDLAKQRTRRTRTGGWMKKAIPVVYDQHKASYEIACLLAVRTARITLPTTPWRRWTLDHVEFRLHNKRDPLEIIAGLKWPVDWFVSIGIVANDSTHELLSIPIPTQRIDRKHRGITITISEAA